MIDLRSVLDLPSVYRSFQRLVTGDFRAAYVREYVQPRAGERVFDMGCGPGDVLACLPDVDYVGIDINAKYIRAAQARYRGRGTFRCQAVSDAVVREPAAYDIVMANAVLHHLSDEEARHLLALASQALKPAGRFVAFDCALVPGQPALARLLARMDRGRFVRTPAEYAALARECFGNVEGHVRHNLLRVPYTHHIIICTGAAHAERALRRSA